MLTGFIRNYTVTQIPLKTIAPTDWCLVIGNLVIASRKSFNITGLDFEMLRELL